MKKLSMTGRGISPSQGIFRKKRSRITVIAAFASLALVVPVLTSGPDGYSPAVAADFSVLDGQLPKTLVDPDRVSVELGATFSSSQDGTVSAIRFYKPVANVGPHVVNLWSISGQILATAALPIAAEPSEGWQTVKFPSPVKIAKDQKFLASYIAPQGQYSSEEHGLAESKTNGPLTLHANGGVYAYGTGGEMPQSTYMSSNYFVDVVFTPTPAATIPPSPTSPPPTPTPGATPPPVTPGTVPATLNLPRIPWEGGASYWKQFQYANDAGWSDPGFFPIVAWFNGISSDAEAQYDKKVGINTYIGMDASTPYSLFQDNDMYWIGGKLNNTFTDSSTNWVGNFLDDEVDGRFTPEEGRERLQLFKDQVAGNGRFNYANFTQIVMSNDMPASDSQAYVNNYTDAVSIDMYWYTIPFCDWSPYRENYITPIAQENCRTASSYGKTMESLRQQDAADGVLQSPWQFVELLNGGPGGGPFTDNVTPGQLKGSVMSSIINEARGLVYFNQSLSGPCQGGSLIRQSQVTPNFCGQPQVDAATAVNSQIRTLAPVLNTQSYDYSFGPGLDTMLKTHNGAAYIFAMVDGNSTPGDRLFTLPEDIKATSVQVVDENRSIQVNADGTFTDSFPSEYSYHIYKIG